MPDLSLAAAVLGIGDMVAPLGLRPLLTFVEAFCDGKVGHEVFWAGPVPVPLPWRGVDGVTCPDLHDLCAARLGKASALGHVQGLTIRVPVPSVASPGREADDGDPYPGGRIAPRNDVHPDIADEQVSRSFGGRLFGLDLQLSP